LSILTVNNNYCVSCRLMTRSSVVIALS